jgi:fatty-acyl-CoA synthase
MIVGKFTKPWVDGKTIGQVLRLTAARHGHQEALVFRQRGLRLRYAEFDRQVDQAARGLLGLGLGRGDHLAIWATNCPEWVILQCAAARIGVLLVTINPAYRARELEYALRQSDARGLALTRRFRDVDYHEVLRDLCPEMRQRGPGWWCSSRFPRLQWIISLSDEAGPGMLDWAGLLAAGDRVSADELGQREAEPAPEDPISILYTSGTTGFPKGAMLTHRNLLLNVYYAGDCQHLSAADRMCIPVPLYHCFGCVLGTLCAVVYGAAMIFPWEQYDAGKTLEAIEAERCTVLYGVPTMFITMLEHQSFGGRDLSSLRTGIMAGAPCPLELMRKVTGVMGCREITIAYGQTEASPLITQTRAEDPIELRVGTVGRPFPGLEVKIVEPVTGRTLDHGEPGDLCARGHAIMKGYYNMPEQTAEAIDAQGWLHTGDLAVSEPDGYFRIVGRLKDLIIRGGENIYPREIEEFLFRHPTVEQAVVVGVPDAVYGEQVLACIKLRDGQSATAEEIRRYCRRSLAHFKVPHYIEFVDRFPMTVTGKVQKYKLREQAVRELGLEKLAEVQTA